ncbi:MAG: CidA/LrgA family protein, partial [Muribaculaceae bacterium]|nr:CidA/LrgA family protein [Muribaculaceae bacterium]
LPIPSSIIGMILLTASLHFGIVKLNQVEQLTNFLLKNLGFFFVPAAIGLINSLGVLKDELLAIVGASIGSTIIIIAVTGQVYQLVRKATSRRNRKDIKLSQEK